MTEPYPISCISCRRKKIKCNKHKPCNQCQKREIVCEFPSTFRNIEIDTASKDSTTDELLQYMDNETLIAQVKKLKNEKSDILQNNLHLIESNKFLSGQLKHYNIEHNYDFPGSNNISHNFNNDEDYNVSPDIGEPHPSTDPMKITGETSEFGKKYYGPQSSSFMIETLKSNQMSNEELGGYSSNFLDKDNDKRLEKSLIKKSLPMLRKDEESNIKTILLLVDKFFLNYSSNFYKTYIAKGNILDFLNDYKSIKENLWENDDDLLLLYMVLTLSVERLTPIEIMDIFEVDDNDVHSFKHEIIYSNLFFNFVKLRHNLVNESILTIVSYILCTEWYFIHMRYEEAWSMMFHACSIAYSIGLHVTGKLRLNEIDLTNNENDESGGDFKDEFEDILKLKVWFSLRILSGKVCSIFGRPNPISIQINSTILKSSQNISKIDLSQNKTSILLKIGLSDCIRLSNMMIIENFMIDFEVDDLLNLNLRFENEIELLEQYLHEVDNDISSQESIVNNVGSSDVGSNKDLSFDEQTLLPLNIEKMNLLNDLIIFYINKAKLFEPFILKFTSDEETSILIIKNLSHSIVNFLKYTIEFLDLFFKKLESKDIRLLNVAKFFRVNFPFLNAFIYQGIIVIFTLLNYKYRDFIALKYDDKFDNNEFSSILRSSLLEMTGKTEDGNLEAHMQRHSIWSSKVVYLVNKNIEIIDLIFHQQKRSMEINFENEIISNQIFNNDFLSFNLNDPFWITNPDNLSYYLSSPSDDSKKVNFGFRHQKDEDNSSNESSYDKAKKMKLNEYSEYDFKNDSP